MPLSRIDKTLTDTRKIRGHTEEDTTSSRSFLLFNALYMRPLFNKPALYHAENMAVTMSITCFLS